MTEDMMKKVLNKYTTPFYVFDTDIMTQQIKKIREALGPKIELCYAMKANPFVIKEAENYVNCFEVCSPGEFSICERADIQMSKVVMSGVYKSDNDVMYAMSKYGNSILYTVESFAQWQIIENCAKQLDLTVNVLLRLSIGNQFGMSENVIKQIIADRNNTPNVKIYGIQFFPGTQKKSTNKFQKELGMLDEFCSALKDEYNFTAEKIEYGPGLPIAYFKDDDASIEDSMLELLSAQLQKLNFSGQITLEIGRYIVANCGYYFSSVVDTKENNAQKYCIIDGGIHQVNYFGQMMAMKQPAIVHLGEKDGVPDEWTICGALCTTNDILVKKYPFVDLKIGDKLIFKKTGAYSVTEGISLFLSRDLPKVLLYSEQDQFRLARDSFATDSLNYFKK